LPGAKQLVAQHHGRSTDLALLQRDVIVVGRVAREMAALRALLTSHRINRFKQQRAVCCMQRLARLWAARRRQRGGVVWATKVLTLSLAALTPDLRATPCAPV
jgi:hypothetical protein